MDYIIVQAGGKGSRMQALTRNKPKALVPVNNLPMIFHLFRKYPDKRFIVIGDYKYDVIARYLNEFADVDYQMVSGTGHKGTCAGLKKALSFIPDNERFMLIWCDLVLPDDYTIPDTKGNIIGISKDFPCRWMWKNGEFKEERSQEFGVAGLFIFENKLVIDAVPEEGEFVRWLKSEKIHFTESPLYKTREYGLYEEWDKLPKLRCRPFNSIRIDGDLVIKEGIDDQGKKLATREAAWYKSLKDRHFINIPTIYEYEPRICMERIKGKNVYEYPNLPFDEKRVILEQIVACLKKVHSLASIPTDNDSYRIAYIDKTYDRLEKVRYLVPFANDEWITINGKVCRNIFYIQDEIEKAIMQYVPTEFNLIHGDCTFSNILLKDDRIPVLIDPRGYFGNTELFGDAAYDWVKLYYSLFSNYDQFNLKKFDLYINKSDVRIEVASNNWESLEDEFFRILDGEITRKQMKLLLAIVWLSLTTYAWEDYDSICGSFYIGLYYLGEALENEK